MINKNLEGLFIGNTIKQMHMKAKPKIKKIKKIKKITIKESAAIFAEAVAKDRAELRRKYPPGTYVLDIDLDAFYT